MQASQPRHHNISLDWCLTYGHRPPYDQRTARNVLDCIVGHARQDAYTPEEVAAVDAAERNAKAMLADIAEPVVLLRRGKFGELFASA